MLCVRCEGYEARNNAPSDLEPRQPEARPDIGKDDQRGDEHETVGDVEVGGKTSAPGLPVSKGTELGATKKTNRA